MPSDLLLCLCVGEVLRGDRIVNTPYEVTAHLIDVACSLLTESLASVHWTMQLFRAWNIHQVYRTDLVQHDCGSGLMRFITTHPTIAQHYNIYAALYFLSVQ